MKVDAKVVADHVNMVAMGGRMTEVVLGPDFKAQVADEAEEIMMRAKVKGVKFPETFGVIHASEFAKILKSFNSEVDLELKDGKLVMKEGGVVVVYQTAAIDAIDTTIKSFTKADNTVSETLVVKTQPEEGFLANYSKYRKLISPDLVEIATKGKMLVLRLVNVKGHSAEVPIGNAEMLSDEKFEGFKVSAAAFSDVLAGVSQGEDDQLEFAVGVVLRVNFRTYTFLVKPQVELEE